MSRSNLAIVIPAFKIDFFDKALESIAIQSCKDFTLYIGDDASKSDLKGVADKYINQIDIVYHRFENNLGGTDLIAHWNRCVDLVQGEEWVWLFSDDDFMGPGCVEDFYKNCRSYPNFDIFHFNLVRVNQYGEPLSDKIEFPEIISIENLLVGRLRSSLQTTVVEYVFRRSRFVEEGYFQNFDLAWGSDDATWIKIARNTNIKNINESTVYWRSSNANISTQNEQSIVFRKMNARIAFINWLTSDFRSENLKLEPGFLKRELWNWFRRFLLSGTKVLSFKEVCMLVSSFNSVMDASLFEIFYRYAYFLFHFYLCRFKMFVANLKNKS